MMKFADVKFDANELGNNFLQDELNEIEKSRVKNEDN